MKTRGLQSVERGRLRGLDHRGVRTDKSPPVAGEYSYPEPALCGGCGAVYVRKTWRRISAVESRARHSQPERRFVQVARRGEGLEVSGNGDIASGVRAAAEGARRVLNPA